MHIPHTLPLWWLVPRKIPIIFYVTANTEWGWLAQSTHQVQIYHYQALSHGGDSRKSETFPCNLHELNIICDCGGLSTAEVSLYQRTIAMAHYHTVPKRYCGKNTKTSLQVSSQRLLQGHTHRFTVCRRQTIHFHCTEPPSPVFRPL